MSMYAFHFLLNGRPVYFKRCSKFRHLNSFLVFQKIFVAVLLHKYHCVESISGENLWENMTRSTNKSNICGLCGSKVVSKDEHLKLVHKWVECPYCHNSMQRSAMDNHLKEKHRHESQTSERRQNDKIVAGKSTGSSEIKHLENARGLVRCKLCKNTMTPDLLEKHLKRSHGQPNSLGNEAQALERKLDQETVAGKPTGAKTCCVCKTKLDSVAEHLERAHGWVRCKVCNNLMAADALHKHLNDKHNQPLAGNEAHDSKSKHDDDAGIMQNQTCQTDEPKMLPNQSLDEYQRPWPTIPPSVDLMSKVYDLVAEKNEASFINTPQPALVANKDETYLNTILISDKELNKLMARGRIGIQRGQLMLHDS